MIHELDHRYEWSRGVKVIHMDFEVTSVDGFEIENKILNQDQSCGA